VWARNLLSLSVRSRNLSLRAFKYELWVLEAIQKGIRALCALLPFLVLWLSYWSPQALPFSLRLSQSITVWLNATLYWFMCYAFPLIFEKLLCSIKLLYSSKLLHRVQRQKRKILDWCYSKHWLQMVFYFLKADCWAIVIDPAICDIQQILRILSLSGFLSCGSVAGRNSVLAEQSPCETIPVLLKLLNLSSG
jgi:hypothetical protein